MTTGLRAALARARARLAPTDLYTTAAELRRAVRDIYVRLHALEKLMATDRDTIAAIVTGLNSLGPAIDALAADRDAWRDRAQTAEGTEAADEAADTAAAQPAKDLVDALVAKLGAAAPGVNGDVTSPEEATRIVQDAPDPAPVEDTGGA